MSTIVCKFGGSSLSTAAMFQQVRSIVHSDPARKYIVLSAPGKRSADDEKITDLLYRAHHAAKKGDTSILSQIFNRYADIARIVAPEFDLQSAFQEIQTQIIRSSDFAASRGEYLCAKLFAAYLNIPFVDAADLLFFQANGSIDLKRSAKAIRQKLAPLPCAVIPGFYGTDASGNIKTFSRGGSDVSGALICRLLHANLYENWTDVSGLFTADPRIVPEAHPNRRVSYAQMEHIACAGAQLLHPDALRLLSGTGIDTCLKNSFQPDALGTLVSDTIQQMVPCITGRQHISFQEKAAASVCVFGLPADLLPQIQHILHPIHIIHMQDHIQIITPPAEYETTIRSIHKILFCQ